MSQQNQELVLLQDIYRTTSEDMSLQLYEVVGLNKDQINVFLDDVTYSESPMLLYRTVQNGRYEVSVNGKAYIKYDTDLAFMFFADEDATITDLRTKIRQIHGIALEFFKRLIRQTPFAEYVSNGGLDINFDEVAYMYDSNLCGVYFTFQIGLDPNDTTPSC